MRFVDVALVEWPNGPGAGGPRLLGRLHDPDIVRVVRERLADHRRAELERLSGGLSALPEDGGSDAA